MRGLKFAEPRAILYLARGRSHGILPACPGSPWRGVSSDTVGRGRGLGRGATSTIAPTGLGTGSEDLTATISENLGPDRGSGALQAGGTSAGSSAIVESGAGVLTPKSPTGKVVRPALVSLVDSALLHQKRAAGRGQVLRTPLKSREEDFSAKPGARFQPHPSPILGQPVRQQQVETAGVADNAGPPLSVDGGGSGVPPIKLGTAGASFVQALPPPVADHAKTAVLPVETGADHAKLAVLPAETGANPTKPVVMQAKPGAEASARAGAVLPGAVRLSSAAMCRMIVAYEKVGRYGEVEATFAKIRAGGGVPDAPATSVLLGMFARTGKQGEAEELLQQARTVGVRPTDAALNALVEMYAEEGEIEKMEGLVAELAAQGTAEHGPRAEEVAQASASEAPPPPAAPQPKHEHVVDEGKPPGLATAEGEKLLSEDEREVIRERMRMRRQMADANQLAESRKATQFADATEDEAGAGGTGPGSEEGGAAEGTILAGEVGRSPASAPFAAERMDEQREAGTVAHGAGRGQLSQGLGVMPQPPPPPIRKIPLPAPPSSRAGIQRAGGGHRAAAGRGAALSPPPDLRVEGRELAGEHLEAMRHKGGSFERWQENEAPASSPPWAPAEVPAITEHPRWERVNSSFVRWEADAGRQLGADRGRQLGADHGRQLGADRRRQVAKGIEAAGGRGGVTLPGAGRGVPGGPSRPPPLGADRKQASEPGVPPAGSGAGRGAVTAQAQAPGATLARPPPAEKLSAEDAAERAVSILEEGQQRQRERSRRTSIEGFATTAMSRWQGQASAPGQQVPGGQARQQQQQPRREQGAGRRVVARPRAAQKAFEEQTAERPALTPEEEEEVRLTAFHMDAEDAVNTQLHARFMLEFEPQYHMEVDGNPDIEERPPPSLEEVLEHGKQELMAAAGILSEEEWQAEREAVLARAPALEALVETYTGPRPATAREEGAHLDSLTAQLPPHLPPELRAFAERALLSLKSNPGFSSYQKHKMVSNMVNSLSAS